VIVKIIMDRLGELQQRCFMLRFHFAAYWRVLDEALMRQIEARMEEAVEEIVAEHDCDELALWEELVCLVEQAIGVLEALYKQREEECEAMEEEREMQGLTASIAAL
jgi:predicted house-cleaning noncanonical NTP pyrophosphatase (MazG superfamily)